MTGIIAVGVVTVVVIAAADVLAPKFRTAAPLILVVLGIAAGFIPGMPAVELEPDVVLELILPPLLFGAAVAMPAMSFRRDLRAITWLAVPLVVLSALVLGLLFWWLVPGLGLLWGVALGAVLSPTDAVATSIIKGRGVPSRVVTILEGESLLNDASSLVLLRTAAVATVAGFSLWGALGTFFYSVVVAVAIGALVGVGNFWIRRRITSPTVNTILSFTLPFLASVPTEMLGASGLVAAVVAGLIIGFRGPRILPPQDRLTMNITWSSIQLILEGFLFLSMGLQVKSAIQRLEEDSIGIWAGIGIAVLALVVTLLVRTASLAPQLMLIARRARRGIDMKPRIEAMRTRLEVSRKLTDRYAEAAEQARAAQGGQQPTQEQMIAAFRAALRRAADDGDEVARRKLEKVDAWRRRLTDSRGAEAPGPDRDRQLLETGSQSTGSPAADTDAAWDEERLRQWWASGTELAAPVAERPALDRVPRFVPDPERLDRYATRLRRASADIGYLASQPLGVREGAVLVWAGMRGAVTVAAAQTLPEETPHRALLIFVAYTVATLSLLIQGGTIGAVVRWLYPPSRLEATRAHEEEQRRAVIALMQAAAAGADAELPEDAPEKQKQLASVQAQRSTLLDARDDGLFDPEVLEGALTALDAEWIGLQMRGGPEG